MGLFGHSVACAATTEALEGKLASAPVALTALSIIAERAPRMCDVRLGAMSGQAAAEGLDLLEQQAQRCLGLLLAALGAPGATPASCGDALWALNAVARKGGEPVARWMLSAGGPAALRSVLLTCQGDDELLRSAIWLVYHLDGLKGLAGLLDSGRGDGTGSGLPEPAVAAVAWVVYELSKEKEQAWCTQPAPEAAALLRLLISLLGSQCRTLQVRWACSAALDALMKWEPRMGALFCELGGAPLLVEVLRFAAGLGPEGEELSRACVYAMTTLVDGSALQAQVLREAGAPQALAQLGVRGLGSLDEEGAVWALGQLSGLGAVLEVMARAPGSTAALRGGLDAIASLAAQPEQPGDLERLPQVLASLLNLLQRAERPVATAQCINALGSAACGLAPHAQPGQLPELDRAVMALLGTLQKEPPEDSAAAENAVGALGRLALLSQVWREGLKGCGAVGIFAVHIDNGLGSRTLSKYCCWAAAALMGMPFVLRELQVHLQCPEKVDAALCTMGDILDDDLESEYALKGTERCSEADVPGVLTIVAEAMLLHESCSEVQRHGCHCLGLLAPLVPPASAPSEAPRALLAAARRHPRCLLVVQQACRALRALLGPRTRTAGQEGLLELTERLKREGAAAIAERAVADFAGSGDPEVLEDAVAVVADLSGVRAALALLAEVGPGQARSAGVKAIFELCRQRPSLLSGPLADEASKAVAAMLAESQGDEALRQSAALLLGLCGVDAERLAQEALAAAAAQGRAQAMGGA